jgi:hypothetical protein
MAHCPGCEEGWRKVTESEIAEHFPAGSVVRRAKLCMAAGDFLWHVPPELARKMGAEKRARSSQEPRGALPRPGGRDRARKPGEPLEEEVWRGVRDVLTPLGWELHHFEQGYRLDRCPSCQHELGRRHATTRVPKGTPDVYVVGHGFSFWIELKRPGGAVKEEQHTWHESVRAHGVRVYVIRSALAAWNLHEWISTHHELPPDGEFPPPEEEA